MRHCMCTDTPQTFEVKQATVAQLGNDTPQRITLPANTPTLTITASSSQQRHTQPAAHR